MAEPAGAIYPPWPRPRSTDHGSRRHAMPCLMAHPTPQTVRESCVHPPGFLLASGCLSPRCRPGRSHPSPKLPRGHPLLWSAFPRCPAPRQLLCVRCSCAWPAVPVRTKTKYSTCLVLLLHTCVYDVFHGTPRGPVEFVPDPCVVSPVPIPSRPAHHSVPLLPGRGVRPPTKSRARHTAAGSAGEGCEAKQTRRGRGVCVRT